MRAVVMFLFLSVSVPCYAQDPLETLNTIEDTLSTMEQTLKLLESLKDDRSAASGVSSEGVPLDDELYFVADRPLGLRDWVPVRPCTEEIALAQAASDSRSCVWKADGTVALGGYYWRSRLAEPGDLRVGKVVVTREKIGDGAWVLAKITDISKLGSGYLAVTAPFPAPLKGLRVVEQ